MRTALSVEYELLPDLTLTLNGEPRSPSFCVKNGWLAQNEAIKTCLRVTPMTFAIFHALPLLRHGKFVDDMFRCFELCAQAERICCH
jgi:hypothetical protein